LYAWRILAVHAHSTPYDLLVERKCKRYFGTGASMDTFQSPAAPPVNKAMGKIPQEKAAGETLQTDMFATSRLYRKTP
jgi:hypothetical protein